MSWIVYIVQYNNKVFRFLKQIELKLDKKNKRKWRETYTDYIDRVYSTTNKRLNTIRNIYKP